MAGLASFRRLDVSRWPVVREEQVGAEAKEWLKDPDGVQWLFKPVRFRADEARIGLDWAEKVAAEIAGLLALPHAEVELAVRGGKEGSVSRDVRVDATSAYDLRDGADQLLDVGAPGFRPSKGLPKSEKQSRPGHSLVNIAAALANVDPPTGGPAGLAAFDIFTGYLVLDAWIGNADRHDQNWAVLEPTIGLRASRMLSPTFDHGSAFGVGLMEEQRAAWAADDDAIQRFARGGRATPFKNEGKATIPSLVTLAAQAIELCTAEGRRHWRIACSALPVMEARNVIQRVPVMSVATRTFVVRLVEENARRIRHECGHDA
ncbi:hypothetical protein [Luteimicrobium sp. DT211]|uniref:hypothetical protein n=1 Tax=Luteimicrobium sp. DT211 TaxID=3393412 RepID=UPI003CEDFDAB